ncbi:protocadherin-10-like isoform X1 [Lethenteron reissneri]|uniref:protocadherin-10-like isoform X1 n=1 Tax=Lethenteron reissneri TaxID=7753 RepID=UPI002AB6F1B1|nr:protocadherin-10-like isoform X1 [Lethenteron reissneri]
MPSPRATRLPIPLLLLAVAALGASDAAVPPPPLRFSVDEESPPGTALGNLAQALGLSAAELRARRPDVISASFRVAPESGDLTTASRFDRESLCPGPSGADDLPPCTLDVPVVLEGPSEVRHVRVEVLDVNDHAPEFASHSTVLNVSEATPPGTAFPLEAARDLDAGANSVRGYELSGTDAFGLDESAAWGPADGPAFPSLRLLRPLDREERAVHAFTLTARDGAAQPRVATQRVVVRVLDANDNAPVFSQVVYHARLREGAPRGLLVARLNATDADEGDNGRVEYSARGRSDPRARDLFSVDRTTGEVRLRGALDREQAATLELRVQARDLGPDPMTGYAKVLVTVLDENDNAPRIALGVDAEGTARVPEGEAPGSLVASLLVSDPDDGDNGRYRCWLEGGGPFELLRGDAGYSVVTSATLDRETTDSYELLVRAEDRGSPPLDASAPLRVVVTDRNDNAPGFTRGAYEFSLLENNVPGAFVATVEATDPDLGDNGRVVYSIAPGGSPPALSYVSVDGVSGKIYALRSLDRESLPRLSFAVEARDLGEPQLNSTARVTIAVRDANDNAPAVSMPRLRNGNATRRVLRQSARGSVVLRVQATDADEGDNGRVSYSVVHTEEEEGGEALGWFAVDARSGELTNARSFAPGDPGRFEVTVEARDHGSPALTARATITVILVDTVDELNPGDDDLDGADDGSSSSSGGSSSGGEGESGSSTTGGEAGRMPLSLILIIALGGVCSLLFVAMVVIAVVCKRENKEIRTYNCRTAEAYLYRKPHKAISKRDIVVVPPSEAAARRGPRPAALGECSAEGEREPGQGAPHVPESPEQRAQVTRKSRTDLPCSGGGSNGSRESGGLGVGPRRGGGVGGGGDGGGGGGDDGRPRADHRVRFAFRIRLSARSFLMCNRAGGHGARCSSSSGGSSSSSRGRASPCNISSGGGSHVDYRCNVHAQPGPQARPCSFLTFGKDERQLAEQQQQQQLTTKKEDVGAVAGAGACNGASSSRSSCSSSSCSDAAELSAFLGECVARYCSHESQPEARCSKSHRLLLSSSSSSSSSSSAAADLECGLDSLCSRDEDARGEEDEDDERSVGFLRVLSVDSDGGDGSDGGSGDEDDGGGGGYDDATCSHHHVRRDDARLVLDLTLEQVDGVTV